jgi:fused signal recognition particle receptor
MFGFLKKKLKEGIEKITKTISEKEEEKIKEAVEEVKKEEHLEESKKELIKEVEKEIEKPEEIKEVEEKPKEEPKEEKPEKAEEKIEKKEVKLEIKKEEIKTTEVKITERAEAKIEEAKEIVETAKEIEKIPEAKIEEKPKKGFFERILKRKPKKVEAKEELKIEKPKEEKGIIDKIKKKITEKKIEEDEIKDILKDMEMSLISSDVAVEVSDKIISDLRKNLVGNFIKRGEIENVVKKSLRDSILDILKVESFDLVEKVKTKKPFLIVFLGFNGVGKTTSIGRIGYLLKKNGISCVFAAADSWRAAAIEQLEEHGKKLGIDVIKHKYGADPAAVIFDAVKHAKSKNIDVVLADTAGRSHSNVNLMDELKKIIKVNKPDLKILVLDALTGNDIYDQCKMFNDAVGVDGLIITKADVYEKGGATLSASHTIKKPILYLGVGQNYEDLEKFDSKKIVEKLLE